MTQTSEDLPQTTKGQKLTDKQQTFVDNLHHHKTLRAAAKAAGYGKEIQRSITSYIKRSPALTKAMRTYYLDHAMLLLHDMSLVDKNVLDHCKDPKNIKDVPKHGHMLRQIKQAAGVLAEDTTPRQPTVNIAHIEKVQVAISDMLTKRLQGTGNTNDTP